MRLPEPISFVALLLPDNVHAWVGVRLRGQHGWRAAEKVFAEALLREQTAPPPAEDTAVTEQTALPPQVAQALWAQPANLPSNPDLPMYREMVDSAAAGFFTLTRDARFTYVNSTAEQLIQVQYDLTPTMSIVAARDETGVFSVVYKIRHGYR